MAAQAPRHSHLAIWSKVTVRLAVSASVVYDTARTSGLVRVRPSANLTVAGTAKIGEGAASNTSKLLVNTLSGVAAGIQLFQDANESWIIQNPASTTVLTFGNSGTERMRITSTGNVGIGTSSPGYTLDVRTNASNAIRVGSNGNSFGTLLSWDNPAGEARLSSIGAYALTFGTNTTERMRIDSSGNVGIGTSSPQAALDVAKSTGNFFLRDGTIANASIFMTATGTSYAEIQAAKFGINFDMPLVFQRQGGLVGIGTSSPSTILDATQASSGYWTGSSWTGTPSAITVTNTNLGGYDPVFIGRMTDSGGTSKNAFAIGAVGTSSWTAGDNASQTADVYFAVRNNAGGITERMRITTLGNVGIGTSSPAVKLDVVGAGVFKLDGSGSTTPLILRNNNTASTQLVKLGFDSNGAVKASINAAVYGNDYMTFNVGSDTERMRINSSGNVGIGTTSPATKFVVSNGGAAGLEIDPNGGIGGGSYIQSYNRSTGSYTPNTNFASTHTWYIGATRRMDLDASGNLGIGTTSPISGAGLTIGNDGTSTATVKQSFSTAGTERAFISLNAGSGEMRYSAGYPVYGGFSTFYTVGSERMRIDGSGNVGIGTSSPQSRLNVDGGSLAAAAAAGILAAGSISTGRLISGGGAAVNAIHTYYDDRAYELSAGSTSGYVSGIAVGARSYSGTGGDAVTVWTRSAERMRIDGSGQVGIGTSSPTFPLCVSANSGTDQAFMSGIVGGAYFGAVGAKPIIFQNDSTEKMRIDTSGNVGIGTTGPGVRLDVRHNQAANSFFDYYNTTFGGGVVWRQIVPNIANTGLTTVDIAKVAGGAFVINNNDTNAANFTAFGVGASERMRITSAGDVGIGTTTTLGKFSVQTAAASSLSIRDGAFITTTPSAMLEAWNTPAAANTVPLLARASEFRFGTDSGGTFVERMRIDASGNASIGTTAGLARLRVVAAGAVNAPVLGNVTNYPAFFSNSDAAYGLGIGTNGSDGHVWLQAQRSDSATAYNLTLNEAGGNVGIGTSSPATRLQIAEANRADSTNFANVGIYTTTTQSTGVGGTLALGGLFNGSDLAPFGSIRGGKQNSTNGNYDGYLAFQTIANGGVLTEKMRIDSSGNVGIGCVPG
jgi:hypothetical protein